MENTHRVVAWFDEADDAREAMVDLEVKGIDADAIHITTPAPTAVAKETAHRADLDVIHRLGSRTLVGGLLGAAIGAAVVVGALVVMRVDSLGTAVIVGAIAGASGGALIGSYWGMVTRLPVNEEAFDTSVVGDDKAPGIELQVRLDDPHKESDAVGVLRQHHAQQINREVA